MSIFPTKVLLATDGSKEADLAARTAAELADKTGSELHVVHVFGITPWYPAYPEGFGLGGAELEDPALEEDLQRSSEHRARELLDAEEVKALLIRQFGRFGVRHAPKKAAYSDLVELLLRRWLEGLEEELEQEG